MASAKVWSRRIDAWRASGLKSEDFCAGGEFSAGLLRHWAWRLGKTRRRGDKGPSASFAGRVQLARVVRVPTPSALEAEGPGAVSALGLHVEVGRVRVVVSTGFDGATLSAVLDVLEGRADAHGGGR